MADYPHIVRGRVSQKTNELMAQAVRANPLLSPGALVRMALDSFMPRYSKSRVGAFAELMAGLEARLLKNPEIADELEALAFGKKKSRK